MEEDIKQQKIIIIGGHLTPALAILDELLEKNYKNIKWIGKKFVQTSSKNTSPEYNIIKSKQIPFIKFSAGKLWRKWTLKTFTKGLRNLLLIPWGFIFAIIILYREKPKLLVSFGGYLALPIVYAAKLLSVKVVTHEQTITVGKANRKIGNMADKIFISWKETAKLFSKEKVIYTGNPIRDEVISFSTSNYSFDNDLPIIYVTGGNQGANTINWRLLKIIPTLISQANIIHQTGSSTLTQDYQNALEIKKELPEELRSRYIIRENIFNNEIGEIFSKADLLVSRSGANTITEILYTGKRSILIPIPWTSGNEQQKNAEIVENTGLGYILKQYDEMPPQELYEAVLVGLEAVKAGKDFKDKNIETTQKNARKLVRSDAAENIVLEIEKILQL